MIKLSICIATYKRADYIGETLASIVPQLTDEIELVVLDGASPDTTELVVRRFAETCPNLRYIRLETNSGVDVDFDKAVTCAQGTHCWLFTDDDLLSPDAIAIVLEELASGDPDVLVVDAEVRDVNLVRTFESSRLRFTGRRDYGVNDRDNFFIDAADALSFIGCVIIRRSIWLARDRASFFGSLFVHVGVIFQSPPIAHMRILARPLVAIRMGNAMWSRRAFEIWMFKWPELIWSFQDYSDAAKARVVSRQPWRGLRNILTYQAYGSFTAQDYRDRLAPQASLRLRLAARLMLAIPGRIAHVIVLAKFALSGTRNSSVTYNLLVASRNANVLSRAIGRFIGYPVSDQRNR